MVAAVVDHDGPVFFGGLLHQPQGEFLAELSKSVIACSGEAYPELVDKQEYIFKILSLEENSFYKTIDNGMEILKQDMEEMKAAGQTVMSGEKSFRLYDTYGFPIDLTKEILEEHSFPEKVCDILKEYLDRKEAIVSKETVVLLFADTIISSICYLFEKDKEVQIDYEKLIPAVFKKKEESGIIKYSNITLRELEEMKKILLEEKLYYDFLR